VTAAVAHDDDGDDGDSVSTTVAAERLGVTADAVVKMIDAGTLAAERTGEGKGRYRIPKSQVEEERAVRLARLDAVDATGAEPELRRRIIELDARVQRLQIEAACFKAAVRSMTSSNRAVLDAVEHLVAAPSSNDAQPKGSGEAAND
jgi:excisionase family DNA binding protein